MRTLPLVLLALFALMLVSPLAAADHEFSHRVEIVGRVVDSDGRPAAGAAVVAELSGVSIESDCHDHRGVTNETGDFAICKHVHAMDAAATFTLRVANATVTGDVSPITRRAYAPIVLDEPWGVRSIQGERAFQRALVVSGRVVDALAQPVVVEGVSVMGAPRAGVVVNVTLTSADGVELAFGAARTSEFGDYWVQLAVTDVPEGSGVMLETEGARRVSGLSLELRRADVLVERDAPVPTVTPPGAGTGRVPGAPLALAIAAVAVVALVAKRR